MFCPKCGSQVNDGDLFCRKCGFKLIYPEGENVYTNSTPFMNTDEMQVQQKPVEIPASRSAPLPKKTIAQEKKSFVDKYFNADGRLNRKPYFIRLLILNVISIAPTLILYATGPLACRIFEWSPHVLPYHSICVIHFINGWKTA